MAVAPYSKYLAQPDVVVIGQATEAFNADTIVYVSGGTAALPLFSKALAATAAKVAGPLYLVRGSLNGAAIANGSKVAVVAVGVIAGLAGVPADGAAVYVSDAGAPALTAGTTSRVIGTATAPSGGFYVLSFNGAKGAAAATPTGTANRIAKFDNAGNLTQAGNITEDNTSSIAIFGRGIRLDDGQLIIDGNEQALDGGASYNVPDLTASLEIRWTGGGAGNRVINLPAAPTAGRIIFIMDADGSALANNITIVGKSGGVGLQIEGADTMLMTANWASGVLLALRDRWKVVSNRQI